MALEERLLAALRAVRLDQVLDRGPDEHAPGVPAPPARPPHVDLAVIDLDQHGRPRAAANVLLSPEHPDGIAVALDADLAVRGVRFRRWAADADVVPGRERAALEFEVPYPASLFKLIVAFHVVALAERGVIDLAARYSYEPETSDEEPVTGRGPAVPGTATNQEWLDAMVCASDDRATCALLKQLHDLDEVDGMNATMREMGLGTLQVNGTSARHGGRWRPGEIHMTAMDTARLLLDIGSHRPALYELLADQGCNEALSTANWGSTLPSHYPAPGIPQLVPERWIDPDGGTVTVDGKGFGRDVRPANATAEVTFAHKTGLTYNFASDAGIVRSLPLAPRRHYVVAFIANLGYRYCDGRDPRVRYTERIARLGRRVDELLTDG